MTASRQNRRKVTLKPPTRESLRRAALRYLERYASSSGNLRQVLQRRLLLAEHRGLEHDCGEADIDEILASLTGLGLLDDRQYALDRASALHRRGWSQQRIQADLAKKGLDKEEVQAAFAKLREEEPDLEMAAALAFAASIAVRCRYMGENRAKANHASSQRKMRSGLIARHSSMTRCTL